MVVNKDTVVSSRLMLAVQKDTTWTIGVVDSSDMVGEYASLAINPVTKPQCNGYGITVETIALDELTMRAERHQKAQHPESQDRRNFFAGFVDCGTAGM